MDLLETVGHFNQWPIRGHPSGRNKYARDKLRDEVYRILNPPLLLPPIENEEEFIVLHREGMRFIIPSKIIDIWARLESIVGIKAIWPHGYSNRSY